MDNEERKYNEYLLGEALKMAEIDGENTGRLFDLTTSADENRQLELAFLRGYLSQKKRIETRGGPRWQPREK